MLQAARPERRGGDADQAVILAIVVHDQGLVRAVGKIDWIDLGQDCDLADVLARIVEHADDGSAALIATFENGRGQRHEPPEKFESLLGVSLRHLLDKDLPLGIQIVGDPADTAPIDERLRPADRRQPFAHLLGDLGRALRTSKFEPKPALGSGIAGTDLDEQFGEPLGAERFQVLGVEGLLRGH